MAGDAAELRRLHEAGVPLVALATLFRRDAATVRRLVGEAGGAVRPGERPGHMTIETTAT